MTSLAASQVMAVTRQTSGSQCETVFRSTGEELHLQCMVLLSHSYRKIHTRFAEVVCMEDMKNNLTTVSTL